MARRVRKRTIGKRRTLFSSAAMVSKRQIRRRRAPAHRVHGGGTPVYIRFLGGGGRKSSPGWFRRLFGR